MSAHGVHDFVFAATKITVCSFARSIILLVVLGMPLSASQQMPSEREKLGNVHFSISCGPDAQRQFDRALAMLHSFWYPQALDAFTELASTNADCGMAYWGIAVSARANPLVGPPDAEALERGRLAVENAKAANVPTPRERDYIAAIGAYYHDWKNRDYPARVLGYETAMEQVYRRYPDDSEGALFYALAINEAVTVLPADKSYARPLKAGEIIERVLARGTTGSSGWTPLFDSHLRLPAAGSTRAAGGRAICAGRPFGSARPPHAVARVLDVGDVAGIHPVESGFTRALQNVRARDGFHDVCVPARRAGS